MPKRLVLSGVPGAGKSCFIDWLASRAFYALKGDDDDQKFWVEAILSVAKRRLTPIIWAIGVVRQPLVIEMGFAAKDWWYTAMRTMYRAGFNTWWFDADYADAISAFRSRNGNDIGFDLQWTKIASHRSEIEALYGNRIVKTLRDGRHLRPEEIADVIETKNQTE